MIRSGFKPSGSGLRRTAFKKLATKIATRKPDERPKGLKKAKPRMTPIRKSAKGKECTLRFACCNGDPATTVWAHSNRAEDGKGMGLKARDEEGCYACSSCHAWLDGGYALHMPRETVDQFFDLARAVSQQILRDEGLMK